MFDTMRRLYPRGPTNRGLAVDADGAALGSGCILVRRIAQNYRCIAPEDAAVLQDLLFGDSKEPGWLFGQCRRIAKALDGGEIALAQILGLQIPIGDFSEGRLRGLAAIAPLIKANFNPGEPRVPKGNPDGGEWTAGGISSALDTENPSHGFTEEGGGQDRNDRSLDGSDSTGQAASVANTDNTDGDLLPAAYQGHYHDAVVQALKTYFTAKNAGVVTGIALNAINGVSAVADMIVRLPGVAPFIIEVKTGPGAQFTPSQMIVYTMAQVGEHVSSPNGSLKDIGLEPDEPLPPLDVYVYWVRIPGERGEFIKLPPPELVP